MFYFRRKNGKYFAKTWASPKVFLPLQDERMTFSKALYTSASDPNFRYEDIYPDIVEHIKEVQEEER